MPNIFCPSNDGEVSLDGRQNLRPSNITSQSYRVSSATYELSNKDFESTSQQPFESYRHSIMERSRHSIVGSNVFEGVETSTEKGTVNEKKRVTISGRKARDGARES